MNRIVKVPPEQRGGHHIGQSAESESEERLQDSGKCEQISLLCFLAFLEQGNQLGEHARRHRGGCREDCARLGVQQTCDRHS